MFGEGLSFFAEILLLMSYLTTQMLTLRIVAAISAICFMWAALYAGLSAPGMTPSFIFSGLSLLVNTLNIYRLLYTRMPAAIPSEYLEVYEKIFSTFTAREFLMLLRFSKKGAFENNTLIEENSDCDVFLILTGEVEVSQQNKAVATIHRSNMIGEISYLTHQKTMATVKAIGEVTTVSWAHSSLSKLEKKYEHIFLKFHNILLTETRSKLIKQNATNLIH